MPHLGDDELERHVRGTIPEGPGLAHIEHGVRVALTAQRTLGATSASTTSSHVIWVAKCTGDFALVHSGGVCIRKPEWSEMHTRLITATLLALAVAPGYGVTIGQIDDFEDGTIMGWNVGPDAPNSVLPVNIASGGPAGTGDAYFKLTALGGNGPGSKLSVINASLWTGDYMAAGIGGITMSLNNLSLTNDLYIRLLFVGAFGPMGPSGVAFTDAVHVSPGSGWQNAFFDISPAALTVSFGTATGILSDISELRIFHNPDPFFLGPGGNAIPSVVAELGVDNIQAVPEPSSFLLLTSALGAVLFGRAAQARS
jgi:hypothetical protein